MRLLEELDETAKEHLASANDYMKSLELGGYRLDYSLQHLRTAYGAVDLMYFIGGIIRGTNDELENMLNAKRNPLKSILTSSARHALDKFDLTSYDLIDAKFQAAEFFQNHSYTSGGLRNDLVTIFQYKKLIKEAQKGCFLEAEEIFKLNFFKSLVAYQGGLPKPLVSDEAVQAVLDHAREHRKDGLEAWLQSAEDKVNNGCRGYSADITYVQEKINSYAGALGVPFPEKRFQNILKANARNIALNTIKVFERVDPQFIGKDINFRREWLKKEVSEAKEYARRGGLGLLYKYQLWKAEKIAEERLLIK